jgi:hypothetical protein
MAVRFQSTAFVRSFRIRITRESISESPGRRFSEAYYKRLLGKRGYGSLQRCDYFKTTGCKYFLVAL